MLMLMLLLLLEREPMTKHECRSNDKLTNAEASDQTGTHAPQMVNGAPRHFLIRASLLFRHSSLGFRHLTASPFACHTIATLLLLVPEAWLAPRGSLKFRSGICEGGWLNARRGD